MCKRDPTYIKQSYCCDIFEIHNAAYERHDEMYRKYIINQPDMMHVCSVVWYWSLVAYANDTNVYATPSVDEAGDEVARCRVYRDWR